MSKWQVVNLNTTKHALSAEFSDKDYSWGVSEDKHPISLVGVVQIATRGAAEELCNALNNDALQPRSENQS